MATSRTQGHCSHTFTLFQEALVQHADKGILPHTYYPTSRAYYTTLPHLPHTPPDCAHTSTLTHTSTLFQVTLVQYADKPYALKGMKKDFVMQQGLLPHVKREKVGGRCSTHGSWWP
jgi:hypothetical protein